MANPFCHESRSPNRRSVRWSCVVGSRLRTNTIADALSRYLLIFWCWTATGGYRQWPSWYVTDVSIQSPDNRKQFQCHVAATIGSRGSLIAELPTAERRVKTQLGRAVFHSGNGAVANAAECLKLSPAAASPVPELSFSSHGRNEQSFLRGHNAC
jgi:hypothetical protein